jgi:membrane peptidoglycan carboxypeptidase
MNEPTQQVEEMSPTPSRPAPTRRPSSTKVPKKGAKKKGVRWYVRIFKLFVFTGLLLLIQATVIAYLLMQFYQKRADEYDLTKLGEVETSTLFFDRHGEELWRSFKENRTLLTHDQIPDLMRQAITSIEDERFYEHGGIDFTGLFRAMVKNVRTGRFSQGGSTLSQQLSKHLMGDFSKTIDRKATEAFLATRIEKNFTKAEILDYYLNRVYFGSGNYGLASAAKGYFGKDPLQLTAGECAMLAGIISAPVRNSPRTALPRATERRNIVLDKMVEHGHLSPAQAAEFKSKPLKVVPRKSPDIDRYSIQAVLKQLREKLDLPDDESIPPGLRVYTTLDKGLEDSAQADLTAQVAKLEASTTEKPDKDNPLQGAAMVVDADSGAVRVLVGGRNFQDNKYDRATQARREYGATLQPLIYALAFQDKGLHPASMINASFLDLADKLGDQRDTDLGDPNRDLAKYFLTVHDCLALGQQAAGVRVGFEIGVPRLVKWLEDAGIKPDKTAKDETATLLRPLSLWELCQVYQVLANNGYFRPLYIIERVENPDTKKSSDPDNPDKKTTTVIYQHASPPKDQKPMLDPLVAQQMALTLHSAVREGRARSLYNEYALPFSVAGMVGYSVGYRDSWFVGYTTKVVGGVWLGYDTSKQVASKEVARRAALPVWNELIRRVALNESSEPDFKVPEQLTKVEVNRQTGIVEGLGFYQPASGNIFVYLPGSQLAQSQREAQTAAARIQQPDDWTQWMGRVLSDDSEEDKGGLEIDDEARRWKAADIPPLVWFRLPAIRGQILTSDGVALADTIQTQNLVMPWPSLEEMPTEDDAIAWMQQKIATASNWLGRPLQLADADLRTAYKFKRFLPLTVAEKLNQGQVDKFPDSVLAKEGFSLQGVPVRLYPHGSMAAHTIGWLKRTQGISLRRFLDDEVIYDAFVGDKGLEGAFDKEISGKEGKITFKIRPDGFIDRIFVNEEANVGNAIRTTINFRLQEIVEKHIDEKHTASVVIVDPNNGDIVAMANRPTFNPNDFIPTLDPALWQEFVTAPRSPLNNRGFQQHNPPGSVFKVLTAIASINAGVFDPERVINCPGYFTAGTFTFQLGHERGAVAFRRGMARSFNTFFMDLGLRSGTDAVLNTAREWGYGEKTGIVLPGELTGNVPTPESILKLHKRKMSKADLANISIGQGDMLTTPLQTALFMAAIANNGILWKPRLVMDIEAPDGTIIKQFPPEMRRQIPIHEAEMEVLKDAMVAVTTEGTARRVQIEGMKVAAKTGTAQVGTKSRPRQIAWLGGFLPVEKPMFAFSVMVEGTFAEDLHGGSDAGGLAGKIFKDFFSPAKAEVANQ